MISKIMKVLNDLSIQDLKLNKKRSIVIIIGIILSTALICGVFYCPISRKKQEELVMELTQ